jgi:hypothetical protein
MPPKRKLKPIWDTAKSTEDPAIRSLTNALSKLDIEPLNPPRLKRAPITFGEEVQDILEDWCASQGIPLPPEYETYGADLDRERQVQFKEEMRNAEEEAKAAEARPAGEKPPFGTPEFWAWARKRKLEKEKEAAAKASASTKA